MALQADPHAHRRSRLRKQPTGKKIRITERDVEILRLLTRYRYLRSKRLHAFVGGDPTDFAKRLGHLYHEGGYIDRPQQQWQAFNARYMPAVYELSEAGRQLLRERNCDCGTRRAEARQFPHELMVCDILSSIELGCRGDPSLRFVPWLEILNSPKFPKETRGADRAMALPCVISHTFRGGKMAQSRKSLLPDSVFGIEYEGNIYRFFALEADRNNEPLQRSDLNQTSYLRKILQYRPSLRRASTRNAGVCRTCSYSMSLSRRSIKKI